MGDGDGALDGGTHGMVFEAIGPPGEPQPVTHIANPQTRARRVTPAFACPGGRDCAGVR